MNDDICFFSSVFLRVISLLMAHVETFLQAKLLVVEELHKGWGERMLARFRRSGATEEVIFCFIVVDECVYDALFCGRW